MVNGHGHGHGHGHHDHYDHNDHDYNLLEEVEEALVVSDLLSSVQQRVLLLFGESVSAPGVNYGPARCRIRILSLSIFQVFPYSWSST